MSFPKGFFIGASTAAHQVEGNNRNSDYWAQEHNMIFPVDCSATVGLLPVKYYSREKESRF